MAMAEGPDEVVWRARLRWRLRGAWQWPAFAVCTVADAVILSVLPFAGDGTSFVPAFLLAGFFNLAVVAVVGPLGGLLLRRRRPALPREIATDAAAASALVALSLVLVAAGLAHRPVVREAERDFAAQALAVRRYVVAQAPARFRDNASRADTVKHGPDLYRTCIPGPDPRRSLCLLVTTDQQPPGIAVDPDSRPNAVVSGPDNPGRGAP